LWLSLIVARFEFKYEGDGAQVPSFSHIIVFIVGRLPAGTAGASDDCARGLYYLVQPIIPGFIPTEIRRTKESLGAI
jgi:hypothetical protein